MAHRFQRSSRVLAGLSVALTLTALSVASASAGTKPANDVVGAGAKVLKWSQPSSDLVTSHAGVIIVKRASVIAKVRSLINALPVTSSAPRVCPDDVMIPTTVSFSTSQSAAPYAKVMFQLGGCPYARVYQHGVAVSPTLGGSTISQVYAQIEKLVGATN